MYIAPTEIVDISRLEQNDPRFCINSWKPSASVKQVISGSDNSLSPGRRQAIFRTNVGLLSIGLLRTIFSEILMKIKLFSCKKISSKMSSVNRRAGSLALNVWVTRQQPRGWHIPPSQVTWKLGQGILILFPIDGMPWGPQTNPPS